MSNQEIFERFGCVQINEFLDASTLSTVSQYFENRIKRGEWGVRGESKDTTSRYAFYADPLIEVLLKEYTPVVQEVCGKELLPTYSYARIYQPGEQLKPHTDRPSCEVSVTVNVAYKGEPSSIWMHYENNPPSEHKLPSGGAVIYKGCEARHWRYPLQDDQLVVQFMLHYVDKNGVHSDRVFDRRPFLGADPEERRP
jgi:hypothetical protein